MASAARGRSGAWPKGPQSGFTDTQTVRELMLKLPVIRWGQPYESLEFAEVNHFATGEPIAKVSQAVGGIVKRDMRQAGRARDALLRLSTGELIAMLGKA